MDQFNSDHTRAQSKHTELKKLIAERNTAAKSGGSTAKYTYLISQGVNGLKSEVQSLERLGYLYENPMAQQTSQSANLTSKEKGKRLRMIQDFKESCQITFQQHAQQE